MPLRHSTKQHNVYLEPDDPEFGADHPRNAKETTISATLGNHHLQHVTDLQALYSNDTFKSFASAALGYPQLYPYDDAVSGVNVLFYPPGTNLGWHFDNAAFTTTLMICGAEAGAAFEFVPFLRTDEDRAHDAIGALRSGSRTGSCIKPTERWSSSKASRHTTHTRLRTWCCALTRESHEETG